MQRILVLLLFIISIHSVFGQDFSAKILNKNTQNPVPFATVQTSEYSGVISNEEGFFNLDLKNNTVKCVTVSSLGYKTIILNIQDIKSENFIIYLDEATNELNTVYLHNNQPKIDSVMARVRRHIDTNYKTGSIKHNVFYRETSYIDFKNLDFEIEKASHVGKKQLLSANADLDDLTKEIIDGKTTYFTDFIGEISIKDKTNSKLKVDKATKIINSKKDFSIDNIQEKAQDIILKYLDTTKTYKLKTGLIKVEDSLSLKDDPADKNKEFEIANLKSNTLEIVDYSKFYDTSFINTILDNKKYKYTLKNLTTFNDELIYIVSYKPRKAKAKYEGTLFISEDSYVILKLDFQYAEGKRGKKLNLKLLLGIKFIENRSKGMVIYNKDIDNIYNPRYIKYEKGSYFYVNRPIKFIENSASKNKVLFNFKIEGSNLQKEELLFSGSESLDLASYNSINEAKKVPYLLQKRYDPAVWKNNTVLAPLEELKKFNENDDEN